MARDLALVRQARERAVVDIFVVEPLEDRVAQMTIDHEGADLDGGGVGEPQRRLVGEAHRVDVALPVAATLLALALFG